MEFAICINNKDYESSLETGKLYQVIPDDKADIHGYLRVIDESGEDYAYANDRFYTIQLPLAVEKSLLSTIQA